ncbi:hypothetical protein AC578_1868 [Pseudocercospora eumusae]|uniref:Major facilitator superfamily (MFS) profile domain-containing protein n=1 Tax=Pseudocercospora eumusae TaxID=321146 RepID=A0A139GYE9_9PEZI|nr:hypothetical protein AC578_1868 [Pseudocercospora eumusae]
MSSTPSLKKSNSNDILEGIMQNENVYNEKGHVAIQFVEDPDLTKQLLKKVDWRLIPVLTLLYLMSYMDRSMIGNARIAGLQDDLGLTDLQFNMCLTIFFIPYALLEVPANIMLKLLKPRLWLTIITLLWGAVMTLSGLVDNYSGLLAARFFLGVTEAGFFPAASYILTMWYAKHELQTRMAYFYCAATLAGAFAGLFAYALNLMDGIGGLAGWRWIFIINGLLTVVVGIFIPFMMVDGPEKAKYFTPEQKAYFLKRLEVNYSSGGKDQEGFKWKYFQQALSDWKIWLSTLIFWGNTIPGYGFVLILPTTIKGLGYSSQEAQLLTVPVYVAALIFVIVCSVLSDRYRKRSPFVIYPYFLSATGFLILLAMPADRWPGARYGILFLVAIGLYVPLVGVVSWNANNLAGSWKRSIGMALQITVGNLGGVAASNIYLSREASSYWTGYGVSLAVTVVAIAAGFGLKALLTVKNKRRDMVSEDEVRARYGDEQLAEMGDESPLFRYVL